MTISLLLILLMVFVFALVSISNTYQTKNQEYSELVEPRTDLPQITVKPAPARTVKTPVIIIAAPEDTPESLQSASVRKKQPPTKPAAALVAKQPAKPKPTIKKETRVAQPINESGYLKLGTNGSILPDNATEWACVQDRATGLIWEIKTDDNSMRDRDNFFSWYEPATERNHGKAGQRDGGRCKGKADCDTLAYVQAFNQQQFCGFNDWRLPSRDEMLTLIDRSKANKASINADYFPQTVPSWYWTASSNPDKPDHAWFVLFRNGIALNALKRQPKHVRLVRSRQSEKKTLNRLAYNN
jgi:hypothetical protein